MNSDFSRIITILRKEQKISQKQAAADLDISQALLSHYEKGIRECGLDFLVRIAEYYNVSCDYLLGRCAEPDGNPTPGQSILTPSDAQKHINKSVSVIYEIAGKLGNPALIKEISSYFAFSVYKLFRMLFKANPENDKSFFTVEDAAACEGASALMLISEASIKSTVGGVNADKTAPLIGAVSLSKEYPESSSLLNVVKSSEAAINSILKAEANYD